MSGYGSQKFGGVGSAPLTVPACMTAAKMGDSRSEIQLGKMYLMGRGVAYDPAKAAQWIAESAESGDQEAGLPERPPLSEGRRRAEERAPGGGGFCAGGERGVHSRGGSIGLVLCERDRSEEGLEPGDPLAVSGGAKDAGCGGAVGEDSRWALRIVAGRVGVVRGRGLPGCWILFEDKLGLRA